VKGVTRWSHKKRFRAGGFFDEGSGAAEPGGGLKEYQITTHTFSFLICVERLSEITNEGGRIHQLRPRNYLGASQQKRPANDRKPTPKKKQKIVLRRPGKNGRGEAKNERGRAVFESSLRGKDEKFRAGDGNEARGVGL